MELPLPDVKLPEPTRLAEPIWLEPYPDVLIENELESPPGPEARYETKEAISLAFVTALQLLPARQRAVLILRDVLGFRAAEVAQMLDSSVESVTSALKRARATLGSRPRAEPPPEPGSPAERELVGRLAAAWEANDVNGMVALLADDVRLSMPPHRADQGQRAARARRLLSRRHGRRVSRDQPACGHTGRPADRRHHPLRPKRAPTLRAPADIARMSIWARYTVAPQLRRGVGTGRSPAWRTPPR